MTKMRQWTVMTVIAVVVVVAGGWLLLVKPQGSKISAVKAQAATEQQANQVLMQETAARLAQKKTLPAEQAQLQKLSVQIPTLPNEPSIIRQLQSSATGAGVNLITITPGAATSLTAAAATTTTLPASTPTGTLVELPLTMTTIGSYANVESYLQLLETLPRAMLVTGFSLCPMDAAAGAGCTPLTPPANYTPPANAVGLTLSADVFFSPPAGTTTAPGAATTLPGTATTTPATTPATAPATPAATTTPAPVATASSN